VNIVVVGRGHVGGGLANLWRAAGHDVTTFGRHGGDAASAEVILIAVPGPSIGEALGRVTGLAGQVTIDATNLAGGTRNKQFESMAHESRALIGGPTAKSFNLNYASLYDAVASQRVRPTTFYAGEDGARKITERLVLDAGYEPRSLGGLERARAMEDVLWLIFAAGGEEGVFYRFAAPGDL
jgi:predicted dinucleotide-binding enzyme